MKTAMSGNGSFLIPQMLLCLLFTAEIVRAQTTAPLHDLNGTWTVIPDGTVLAVSQQGGRLVARILVPSSQLANVWGWASNELFFEGVITDGSFSGKRYVHFPVDTKAATGCNMGTQSTEFEFQVIGPNALMGRYRNRILWNNCTITEAGWVTVEFSRKKFDLSETSTQIDIQVRDGILFDLDRDQLKPEALTVLKEIKTLVLDKQRFVRVLVGGYTDDRGSDSHNEGLSTRRAQAVGHWLAQSGVKQEVDVKGFGKREPVMPNTNEANRARNRRVEIKLFK